MADDEDVEDAGDIQYDTGGSIDSILLNGSSRILPSCDRGALVIYHHSVYSSVLHSPFGTLFAFYSLKLNHFRMY